jgi:glycosyltransferase involved in cell wall biosynthesis
MVKRALQFSPNEREYEKESRLSILVLCWNIYPYCAAGAEIHAYYVSNKLAENGNDVHVIAIGPRKQVDNHVRIMFKQSSVQLWRRPFDNMAYVFKVFSLAYLLRRGVNVVQVHYAATAMIPAFMLSKIANKPYVVTCHGSDIRILGRKPYVKFLQKMLLLNASKVISVSKEIRGLLIKEYGLPSQSIRLLPNGYDEELVEQLRIPSSTSVSEKNPSLVFVGGLRGVKDPLNLIDVFKVVSERVKNVHLQIVGDGPLRQAVERKIEHYGLQDRVTMHGAVSNQKALEVLASSQIYVSTSVEEGFPTSLVEAMALGKAVVTTNVGGVPEIVMDGINGLLTPPKSPEKMAQSIELLLNDPVLAEKLGKAAAESVRDFSWNNIAQMYLRVYREVS